MRMLGYRKMSRNMRKTSIIETICVFVTAYLRIVNIRILQFPKYQNTSLITDKMK